MLGALAEGDVDEVKLEEGTTLAAAGVRVTEEADDDEDGEEGVEEEGHVGPG